MASRFALAGKIALAVAALAVCCRESSAQGTSLFGNRGPTGGQSSFGGTQSFGRAGTSGVGTSSNRGAFGGSAGFGATSSFGGIQSGLGTAGIGQAGQGGGVAGSMLGLGQNTFGQASGMGQAGAPGTMVGFSNAGAFIGRGQAGQQQGFQQFGNMMQQLNRGNVRPNQGGNQQQTPQRAIHPRQRVAFDYEAPPVAVVTEVVQTRFQRLATRRPELAGISFSLDGAGVARLRGSVASDDARRLAEALVGLEPGVRQVENELLVERRRVTN